MITQMEYLQKELSESEAQFGKDAPFVKALRAQLQGMKSMQANREQNFLVGTSERQRPAAVPDLQSQSVNPGQPEMDKEAQATPASGDKATPKE
jgi:hypothetical protein